MIVFKKKKILFILTTIIFSVFIYTIDNNLYSSIPTSSTPVSNHVIILDAGHGYPDGGAIGIDGKSVESELNLNIVLKLQALLEASNCTVLLTRSDENGIYDTTKETIKSQKISDMKNRVNIANTSCAEFFISIHMNKISQSKYWGWQTFYQKNNPTSKNLAQEIQTSLNHFIKKKNTRQIKPIPEIYIAKNVEIPLVLIECGFLSNPEENILLQKDSYQNEIAWSIYIGIMNFLNN